MRDDLGNCDYCGRPIGFYGCPRHGTDCYRWDDSWSVEEFLELARSGPECFQCREPITEFNDVRIITVRADGEPKNVWMHADHVKHVEP